MPIGREDFLTGRVMEDASMGTVYTLRPLFRLVRGVSLILASTSPRRREMLDNWGIAYAAVSPPVEEPEPVCNDDPAEFTRQVARLKAFSCLPPAVIGETAKAFSAGRTVIVAADTVVSVGGTILGKPIDAHDALNMLIRLSGRESSVTTSLCLLVYDGAAVQDEACLSDTATVFFHPWGEDVLAAYVATHECDDKAGAYAIQGQGAFLIRRIEGAWSTVVGLPVGLLAGELLSRGLIMPV